MVILIALAALPPRARGALELSTARAPAVGHGGRSRSSVPATSVVAINHPLAGDEHLDPPEAKAFAAGRLTGELPPELVSWVVPRPYVNLWLYASPQTGEVVSVYWPGFALLLAPFALLGVTWACNALLAAGALVLIGRLAGRLSGAPQAAGWAMLLTLASPAFTGMALGYFSMTAHLFFNLLFVWALLERRLFLAGMVGSFALVLHNPWPHFLFSLPWIAWIAWQDGRRALLRLAAGYAPLALALGAGWWLLMRKVQGPLWFAPGGDALFYWQMQLTRVFTLPDASTLAHRASEVVKLWLWTVPGLPALMVAGWWLARREVRVARLLGLSSLPPRSRATSSCVRPGLRLGRALPAPGARRAADPRRGGDRDACRATPCGATRRPPRSSASRSPPRCAGRRSSRSWTSISSAARRSRRTCARSCS